MINVGVLGAAGRMGSEVCRAVASEPGMEVLAAVDPHRSGARLSDIADIGSNVVVEGDIEALRQAGVEVAVDFTTPSSVGANVKWCLQNGIHCVVGTTGLPESDFEELAALSSQTNANVVLAPNFAIGAVLMMRFSEMAAKWLPDAEVIEMHHPKKLDSPSGTALKTVEGITRGRAAGEEGRSVRDGLDGDGETTPGARGADQDGIRVHSVRLPGLVAHQEVIFGGQGQTLSIRHDSIDRSSFMPGVILAIREVSKHPGLTRGLETFLGID